MSLWERLLRHVSTDTDSVRSPHVAHVNRKTRSTPDELKVKLSLFIVEGSHYSPEPLDDGRVLVSSIVRGASFKLVNLDSLLTTSSGFNLLPVHQLQDGQV